MSSSYIYYLYKMAHSILKRENKTNSGKIKTIRKNQKKTKQTNKQTNKQKQKPSHGGFYEHIMESFNMYCLPKETEVHTVIRRGSTQ